jgi:cell wall-associated NlpC family hydrolase
MLLVLCWGGALSLISGLLLVSNQKDNNSYPPPSTTCIGNSIVTFAESFLGTPYVWGGEDPDGFDCSGFVQYVFNHFGITLPRTADIQYYEAGTPVGSGALQIADLLFFETYEPGPSHVGIYIGDNQMINAQSSGVSIAEFTNSYWSPKYLGAKRIITC